MYRLGGRFMHRYRELIHMCIFIGIVILVLQSNNNFLHVDQLNISPLSTPVHKMNQDSLYQNIQKKSSTYFKKPDDAYIDKIWKKTPGRNGLKVDVHKSFEKMNKKGVFNDSLLVYEEVSPDVSLKDLPPAPIYRGHPDKQMVSFLINVSWGDEYIPDLLDILKEHQVKATFFIEGRWAKEHPNLVKMIDEQNHIIGNHAYNHPNMEQLAKEDIVEQISQTNNVLKAITSKTPKYFAPPSGSFNDQVVKEVHALNMETILWTVDTIDWKNPSPQVMRDRVMNNIHPGATILMHPTSSIVQGLDSLIEEIEDDAYKIGTIDELLSEARE